MRSYQQGGHHFIFFSPLADQKIGINATIARMSLHYYIDAYNLLHSTDRWDDIPRSARREYFLEALEKEGLTGSAHNSVTVVFDGHGPRLGAVKLSFVRVFFSGDKDADTVIKEQVEESPNPRNAVVVTNDRSIQKFVKGAGAKVVSCEEFLHVRASRKTRRGSEKPDPSSTSALNAELSRLWKVK